MQQRMVCIDVKTFGCNALNLCFVVCFSFASVRLTLRVSARGPKMSLNPELILALNREVSTLSMHTSAHRLQLHFRVSARQ